jgi:hypothetical protein
VDDYSRAVAGTMVFLGAPSTLTTSLALRQAIWRKADPFWPVCGIPDVLYVEYVAPPLYLLEKVSQSVVHGAHNGVSSQSGDGFAPLPTGPLQERCHDGHIHINEAALELDAPPTTVSVMPATRIRRGGLSLRVTMGIFFALCGHQRSLYLDTTAYAATRPHNADGHM